METVLKLKLGRDSLVANKDSDRASNSAATPFAAQREELVSQQIAAHADAALERAKLGPVEYDNVRVFVDHHPALTPLDPRYAPQEDWNVDIAIPDIAIVGLAKAGTTQLWRLLVSHPDAIGFGPDNSKEFCLTPYDEWSAMVEYVWDKIPLNMINSVRRARQHKLQKRLWEFFHNTFFKTKSAALKRERQLSGKLSVNGCYFTWDVEIIRHYLLPFAKKKNQKYIVLLRDPADLLWSAYNFWKIPGWDRGGEGWAHAGQHYRSPEMFHELLLSGNMTEWFGHEVHDYIKKTSIEGPRKLIGMFGAKNVLLLKNEDMLPSAVENEGGVLDQLSSFTGLARSEFPRHMYSRVSNCNDKAMEDCGESRSSSYHISNDREMLPESRTLVYLHFWEECKIWAQEFGIEFPDCLNVMEQPQVRRLT